ncbi:hypothetical protein FJY94_09110 [Candidatus Kaiserbacteria bacterium]|nr:hypothetical protein [Candidatus Kaiserbacteria bacterium]
MADHTNAPPDTPRFNVRIAETEYENNFAKTHAALAPCVCGVESMTDTELVALLEEPERYAELTPLERELTVRLGALLEVMQRVDASALEQGIALD